LTCKAVNTEQKASSPSLHLFNPLHSSSSPGSCTRSNHSQSSPS